MMRAHQRPVYRSYDGYFTYTASLGRTSRCHLQVYEAAGRLPLVLATEAPDNPGPSITNSVAELATQVWQQLLPHAREGLRFFEVYVGRGADTPRGDETFDEVTFQIAGAGLTRPHWRPRSRAAVDVSSGEEVGQGASGSRYKRRP
jgi:hypothetical protein